MSEGKLVEERAVKPVHTCPDLLPSTKERVIGAIMSPMAAVSLRGKLWKSGQTIAVSFEDRMATGGYELIEECKKHILAVFRYPNLKVRFVAAGQGDVRISFTRGGSWSYLGTDAKLIAKSKHTLQLGWLDHRSSATEIQRVVRHETMHAIGVAHEQGNPNVSIPWDKPKVYDYYRRTQGWDKAQVDAQVLQRYDAGQVNATDYDPNSIMQYPVPNELTTGNSEIGLNTDLSPTDIKHLRDIYPGNDGNDRLRKLRLAKRRIVGRLQVRSPRIQSLVTAQREDRERLERVNKAIEKEVG